MIFIHDLLRLVGKSCKKKSFKILNLFYLKRIRSYQLKMDSILLDTTHKKFYIYFVDIRLYTRNPLISAEMGLITSEGIKVWSTAPSLKTS